ncbi:hypothetical protein FB566_4095 [Stackebrandtia endophytica]|uniref:Enoyl reductase (ER) domain-containing protein n=1 Tax=Stackebrandtia endophytica TaxID=1496996 RepID=A0A543B0Z4_9ACTN|nr:NADP-dependent oxidoreductase [Stackebrandtia endophytica]TQL78507.1 hypothetical protein FB566_4095 [Stackebrandtia endophytica]
MSVTARYVHQVSKPAGAPTRDNFAFVERELSLKPGTALVENLYLSVDPYMRQLMDGGWELNAPLEGRSIGRVIESDDPGLAVGDVVWHRHAWRTHALVTADEARVLPTYSDVPLTAFLGILGGTGLSAYVGLTKVAKLLPGESVFISAAAGAVGSAAGRIARLLGAGRVIGSAGSAAKVDHLTRELDFDAAFNYRDGDIIGQLAKAAPDGIDVYFDNVGGDHLEAAIESLRERGRIAWCGGIAQYNATVPPAAPRNLFDVVGKSLRLEGFLVRDYQPVRTELEALLVPHIQSGAITSDETLTDGFDHIVDGFLGMLTGKNIGKMIVKV